MLGRRAASCSSSSKPLAKFNNNKIDTLDGFVYYGSPLTAYIFPVPPGNLGLTQPGNHSSEQVSPGRTSAKTFPSGHGAGIAQESGFIVGNAASGGYNKSILPLNYIPNANQANITGTMHHTTQQAVTHYSWQGSDDYLPARPIPSGEALLYPTAGPQAISGDQYQRNDQQERDLAFGCELFRDYQNATCHFGPPQITGAISTISPFSPPVYGLTNAIPITQIYGGAPMAYTAVPSTHSHTSVPHPMHKNDDGTPINVAQGCISIERRGVYVHNLSRDATPKDLEDLFRQVGHVERCEVRKAPDKGKRCKATVAFSSEEEAKAAVEKFHGKAFMGRTLTVRPNKDHTKMQEAPNPSNIPCSSSEGATSTKVIIANGSMGDLADDPE